MMDNSTTSLRGEMSIMDRSGHKQLTWDTEIPEQLELARETFNRLSRKGYSAFGSTKKMQAKHLVHEFDPTMEELIMVPRNVGG
jgi:hypothetical protein